MNNKDLLTESLVNKLQETNTEQITGSNYAIFDRENGTIWIDNAEITIGTGRNILNEILALEEECLDEGEQALTDYEKEYLNSHLDTLFVLEGILQSGFKIKLLGKEDTTIDDMK